MAVCLQGGGDEAKGLSVCFVNALKCICVFLRRTLNKILQNWFCFSWSLGSFRQCLCQKSLITSLLTKAGVTSNNRGKQLNLHSFEGLLFKIFSAVDMHWKYTRSLGYIGSWHGTRARLVSGVCFLTLLPPAWKRREQKVSKRPSLLPTASKSIMWVGQAQLT